MTKLLLLLFSVTFVLNSASIHPGDIGEVLDIKGEYKDFDDVSGQNLKISIEYDDVLSSKYFGMFNLTFENLSDKWITLDNIKVSFDNKLADENIKIVSGRELFIWNKQISKLKAINEHNKNLFMGIIALAGASLSSLSNDSNIKALGNVVTSGSLISLAANEYNKITASIEKSKIFPENHLLNSNFTISPGLFDRKWILLNSNDKDITPYITEIYLEYTIENGKNGKVKLIFREDISIKDWQRNKRTTNPDY